MYNQHNNQNRPKQIKRNHISLQWSIIATLVWFNLRGRALSIKELTQLLYSNRATNQEIEEAMRRLKSLVAQHNGNYYIKRFDNLIVDNRRARWLKKKWQIANRGAKLIAWIPYIRLVGVANSLADKTAKEHSDIDFFIIIKYGRLFLTRFLITAVLQLFGLRRFGSKISDRICLSWYITDKTLNFKSIALKPYDILLAYWVAQMKPLYTVDDVHTDFLASNIWVEELVPNYQNINHGVTKTNAVARLLEILFNNQLGNWLEKLAQKIQMNKIARNATSPNPDVKIIANNQMLKFHEIDRRCVQRQQWEQEMRELKLDSKK